MNTLSTCLVAATLLASASAQNQGLVLDATKPARLDVAYNSTVVPSTGVTVEAWITYDETTLPPGMRWPTIIRQNDAPSSETFLLRVDAGSTANRNLKWYVRTSTGGLTVLWSFPAGRLKNWTHVAGTYDGVTARLIVDGVEVASRTSSPGTLANRGGVLRIGNGDLSAPIETWHGELDEVRLWPFARTAQEITNTMKTELALAEGEVSTWSFNGNSKDSSGGNHLTPTGAVTYAANTLTLKQLAYAGAVGFGQSTVGCTGKPLTTNVSWPGVGNGAFGIIGLRGSKNGTAGVMILSAQPLRNPIQIAGADVWVDLGAAAWIAPTAGPLAVSRVALPLPNNPWLIGQKLYTQFFWYTPACSQQLTASKALALSITR